MTLAALGNQRKGIVVHPTKSFVIDAQRCEMPISWVSLALGSIPGAVVGAIADWQIGGRFRTGSQRRALTADYGALAGHYATYRVRDDGAHEATGGRVEILWQPDDGLLEASSFHASGNPEWHSYIRMSREYPGTGIGHYNNVNSIHGGIHQVIYSKKTRCFHVMGTAHNGGEFFHCWKPSE